jgi:L-asparaginase
MTLNPIQRVIILTTGGTIEKTYDESDGTLFNRETVIRQRIENRLRLPYTQIEVKSLMTKDSLDMDINDRETIYHAILRFAKYGDPIVILHGTDTMQQTAEYVQSHWDYPVVPVVFTGAMKPLGFEDSDALQNVTEALMVSKIIGPGIYLSFHNRLFGVPGVRKNRQVLTFEEF